MSNEGERIATLEEKYCSLKEEQTEIKGIVVKIRDNHLVHLQAGLDRIENKLSFYAGVGATIIGIIELIAKFK